MSFIPVPLISTPVSFNSCLNNWNSSSVISLENLLPKPLNCKSCNALLDTLPNVAIPAATPAVFNAVSVSSVPIYAPVPNTKPATAGAVM